MYLENIVSRRTCTCWVLFMWIYVYRVTSRCNLLRSRSRVAVTLFHCVLCY